MLDHIDDATLAGIAMLLVAVVAFGLYIWLSIWRQSRVTRWRHVTARVTSVSHRVNTVPKDYQGDDPDFYRAHYEYVVDGRAYDGVASEVIGPHPWEVDGAIEILVDPSKPLRSVSLDEVDELRWYDIVLLGAGGFLTMAGLVALFVG